MTDNVTIRALTTPEDYAACVELQRDTWGPEFEDKVPASILLVAQKIGGVTAGAFDQQGKMIGFVFGMTGVENGQIVHWSDMLAVRPEAQNLGIGRRLKEHQRAEVARIGGRVIYWTFDPLVARNAHINFNVFGVRAVEYRRDMYGNNTGSVLHRGIGTDRLVVAWPVDNAELAARRREATQVRVDLTWKSAAIMGDAERRSGVDTRRRGEEPRLRIPVPPDIAAIQTREPARAAAWRTATRKAFESALKDGYTVTGFAIDKGADRGYYLLKR